MKRWMPGQFTNTIKVTTKMDVDNGSDGPVSGGIDIEQSLLQQFSCMGTTDKDELVQQLQKLLGSHLNYSTAAFFLDMNNWYSVFISLI
ncbi:hypothetical protein NQ314_019307 [Rhamnusium bicolor]|uniref:Uncharacterized protein n=1 Tax=Rhamnusium bicolor TaxID=1586634 RepID=A0AAV8WPX7_9CUCU|nr:hypothetical protein NQ314_019307 [Rhamnusium bicolor]